ncbi:phytanoyl-CoA dioxygenase family protein [Paenibacillus albus]|uniref:Phytanoyl-CoA dioxygenase family protein n=1 Tax=Paenibacillus albus TaxID=2495582 RepID=A0A3Q8X205_9BACL|nr:phytanoyl-CoA dioxygenase family protein [Paenibacillus albus]AZN38331.1 phytanoyl-CoA dioxygenase family protein [Paenibacillus albus]
MMTSHTELTLQQIEDYKSDGYLFMDDVLSSEEVEELREACASAQISVLRSQQDYENNTVHSLGITALHPAILRLAKHPAIVSKITPLIGANIQLQHSKLATKPPSKGRGIFPWHQDYAFYPHTNTDLLSVMIMLDDATPENGCMSMVKGSHRFGLLSHEKNGSFSPECQESRYWTSEEYEVVDITPRAGGISIHHCLTLHGSVANQSGKPRRGIVFSYRADDAYQMADTIFDDTGMLISGTKQGIVRCDVGTVWLPVRPFWGNTYGSAWNQEGPFAQRTNESENSSLQK